VFAAAGSAAPTTSSTSSRRATTYQPARRATSAAVTPASHSAGAARSAALAYEPTHVRAEKSKTAAHHMRAHTDTCSASTSSSEWCAWRARRCAAPFRLQRAQTRARSACAA
jgi:hypothetical protein